jgi:asparagine synthase (glutamine-hydrolysing)
MSLTGGLDGRMIMSRARTPSVKLPCYTFAGPLRDCTDVKIARRVARVCGQSHETISVGPSFFAQFPELAQKSVFISDGTMDVTGAVELYVNNLAARLAPVRLTGNYGSEIVRRNVAFKPGSACEAMLDPEFAKLVGKASLTYEEERRGHDLTFIAFKQTPWHHYGRLSVEQSCLTMRSPFLDNELVALVYRAPSRLVDSAELSLRLIAEGSARLGKIPTDRGLCYSPQPLVSDLLHCYREFTYKAEYAYDYGMPQWLAKIDHLLSSLHLERLFLGRQKFYHFRLWYRNELSSYVREVLLDPGSLGRSYLNGRGIRKIVTEHIKGVANYTSEIHQLLTSELIHRYLLEQH